MRRIAPYLIVITTTACNGTSPAPTAPPPSSPTSPPALNVLPPSSPASPAVIRSSCSDPARDGEFTIGFLHDPRGVDDRTLYQPACFPRYVYSQEGHFTEGGRPLPNMGRTCGHFNVLVAFTDTAANRDRLQANPGIPAPLRARIAGGDVQGALTDLLGRYTTATMISWVNGPPPPITVSFTVALTSNTWRQISENPEPGDQLGFSRYDAAVTLDDLGGFSGQGVRRWPRVHPMFYGRGFVLNLEPRTVTPGIMGNELLRRNMPVFLSEYIMGERRIVVRNGANYVDQSVTNPRTGENVAEEPVAMYMSGYGDVDHDGVIDCVDPAIAATADNVDADFMPDRLDPDLSFDHSAYFWSYAPR
jgi:hypothetical protein